MPDLFPILQRQESEPERTLPLYREVAWDFVNNQPIFKNGAPVLLEGEAAVRVWAYKALATVRTRYEIYSWAFGCEVETLIGTGYSSGLKRAEAIRYVREALEINPYITSITDVSVVFEKEKLTVSVRMETVYGKADVYV